MKKLGVLFLPTIFTVFFLQSCIVSGPKYTRVEKVMQLRPGMSKDTVNSRLGINPYDINAYDTDGNQSFIYKYRTTDRKTIPFLLKETNGRKTTGKYVDLIAFYDSTNTAYRFESRPTDTKLDEKRLNVSSLFTVVTVTVPSVLVYLGFKSN